MRAVPQLWDTSNGTFVTDKVGDNDKSFWEYSHSKKAHLQSNIVEYMPGLGAPVYDLITGKETHYWQK